MSAADRRRLPARDDLAAAHLKDEIAAPRYAEGRPAQVAAPVADLLRAPAGGLDTQLLLGEGFTVYDEADGWAWGQSALDGYVGYVAARDLAAPGPAPTHRVATLTAHTYPAPELKTRPLAMLSFGARVAVTETTASHGRAGDAWIPLPQLAPLDAPAPDWVAVAEGFLGVPYVWGGRSGVGLDCSGLVQLALQAAGCPCPRDSDMQAAEMGTGPAPGAALCRGDLVFWKGHVGLMRDAETLLHANAHHMAVVAEPLALASARIAAAGDGAITRIVRLDLSPAAA